MTYHYKTLGLASAVALSMMAGGAQAATMNGTFSVTAVNVTNLNSAESQATMTNFDLAFADNLGDGSSVSGSSSDSKVATFTYSGDLSFRTSASGTKIGTWLGTGGGIISDFSSTLTLADFNDLTLSKGSIGNSTATSTFFKFTKADLGAIAKFVVNHDDGMTIYDDGVRLGGFNGPNVERTTVVSGFDGGEFELLYVATNSDPSVLEVSAVPLPASALLLLGGLGGLGGLSALRRRKRTA